MFIDKFDWKWPSASGEEDKTFYNDDDNNDDDEQRTKFDQEKVTWGFGSGELKLFI